MPISSKTADAKDLGDAGGTFIPTNIQVQYSTRAENTTAIGR
jgi:hypothetical protein